MPQVLTLDKSLLVLEAIVAARDGIGTRELARQLELNVATIHNIASTFATRGYVRQDAETRRFHPGLRLMLLGRHGGYLRSLGRAAHESVRALALELNESILLATLDHGHIANLAYVASQQALRVHEPEDMDDLAHCTAVGKILLATLSEAELTRRLREHPLRAFTPRTLADPKRLRAEIELVRRRGYSETHDELCAGISALAVAIHDPWGSIFAALGASAPTMRLGRKEQAKQTLQGLQRTAAEIERQWAQ